MRHPHFLRRDLGKGVRQFIPIGMVAQDQRQFDAALHRALAHAHPPARHRGDRVRQAARPAIVERARRRDDHLAHQLRLGRIRHQPQIAEVDAKVDIQGAQLLRGTVQIDRISMPAVAQFADHPLRLAQCIRADQHAARRVGVQRGGQLVDLVAGFGVAEDRQAEGRLGDEHVALHRLERRTGRIGAAFVIARYDDALAAMIEHDLRRSQHMPGGHEAGLHPAAAVDRLAIRHRMPGLRAIARRHDRERFRRRPHRIMPAARMIGMAVRDERAGAGPRGIDPDIRGFHIDAVRMRFDPVAELCHHAYMVGMPVSSHPLSPPSPFAAFGVFSRSRPEREGACAAHPGGKGKGDARN